MKRTAMFHRKLGKLTARLGSKCMAVGVLESLWHLAAREFPAGNVGKIPDDDIANEIGYVGDAAALIGHLVEIGWLDRHPVHRLIVHDWHVHAEDSVHLWLARNTLFFANGSKPNTTRLGKDDRARIETAYAQCAHNVPTESHNVCSKSTLPLPCLALPSHSQAIATGPEVVTERMKPEEMKTFDNVRTETLNRGIDRTGMIHTLSAECGFQNGRAIQLAGDPWLTPERLRYIIDLARKQCGKDGIQGYVVAGIKGKYVPDPTRGQSKRDGVPAHPQPKLARGAW